MEAVSDGLSSKSKACYSTNVTAMGSSRYCLFLCRDSKYNYLVKHSQGMTATPLYHGLCVTLIDVQLYAFTLSMRTHAPHKGKWYAEKLLKVIIFYS